MAEVILFRPKISKGEARSLSPRPPLGLLFIAAVLLKNNYKVKIIDEETNLHWLSDLNKELDDSTICAGVSSMTGNQILGGLRFVKVVKSRLDIPVVWGGLHASMLPEQTIKDNLVDIVVRGEGEESFLKIVAALRGGISLKDIPNVWWKEDTTIYSNPKDHFIDLNNLSSLPYHLLDCETYIRAKRSSHPNCKRVFDLHTDRGCPHKCGFCYNININKCTWRGFAASNIVEQIEYLAKRFSLDGINFVGDNFFVDKKRVAEVCAEIIKRKIKIAWHADCRVDYFAKYDDSFIDLLKRSGCNVLTFGIESGSPRILGLMHKDIELGEVFKVNERLKKWDLGVTYHFMAGFPDENKEDLLETYKTMLKLYGRHPNANFLGPSIYTPYPGTPLYDRCIELGFRPPQRLQDWARFDWDEKTCLPFLDSVYSKWMMKSVNVVKSSNIAKRIPGLQWTGFWFKFRTKLIVKFNIVGPQPEERFIYLVKMIATFAKKLFLHGVGKYKALS